MKVDAKLKKAYETLVAVIAEASRKEKLDFDRRWESAGAIVEHDPPLYVVGGHRNQEQFFRAVMKEEPRTARRYVRVAKFASPIEEEKYGVQILDAALGFIEAKLGQPLQHPPLPVPFDKLRIPVADGTKALGEATLVEINAATSKLTSATRKKPKTPARAALESSIGAIESLAYVRVAERGGLLSFEGVPLAALTRFAKAILAAKLGVLLSSSKSLRRYATTSPLRSPKPRRDRAKNQARRRPTPRVDPSRSRTSRCRARDSRRARSGTGATVPSDPVWEGRSTTRTSSSTPSAVKVREAAVDIEAGCDPARHVRLMGRPEWPL
ncbi:hypothetical protein BH09MYX1_BH09MYX1_27420 [soil metagenome]